ncbi:MAG: SHOCT domain-containing protein [Patescibacteria group bacterium]|nr:SHOCT domain-containing protein [Patescibacteria group bacterium]
MMFSYGDSWGWGNMIIMLIWWIIIIVAFVLAIRWMVITSGGRREGRDAVEILKERYAKGEIDKKEFEEKLRELKEL